MQVAQGSETSNDLPASPDKAGIEDLKNLFLAPWGLTLSCLQGVYLIMFRSTLFFFFPLAATKREPSSARPFARTCRRREMKPSFF